MNTVKSKLPDIGNVNGIWGRSRAAAASKMECFVIIVNGLNPLTIITKRSILDVPAALDPPLGILLLIFAYFVVLIFYRGPIIQTRIRCKKILLLKSIELGMALEQSATHYKQKINVPLARRATYWKFDFCFWFLKKGKNEIKAKMWLSF